MELEESISSLKSAYVLVSTLDEQIVPEAFEVTQLDGSEEGAPLGFCQASYTESAGPAECGCGQPVSFSLSEDGTRILEWSVATPPQPPALPVLFAIVDGSDGSRAFLYNTEARCGVLGDSGLPVPGQFRRITFCHLAREHAQLLPPPGQVFALAADPVARVCWIDATGKKKCWP